MYSGVPKIAKPFWRFSFCSVATSASAIATPKSSSFRPPSFGQEQVRRLEVAVDEARGVRRLERLARLDADRDRLAPVHPAGPLDVLVERLARRGAPSRGTRARRATCRSRRAARGSGATASRPRAPRCGSARWRRCADACPGRQHLERDLAPELDVLGLVHDAARPFADLPQDTVRRPRDDVRVVGPSCLARAIARSPGSALAWGRHGADMVARASLRSRANSPRDCAGSCGHRVRMSAPIRARTPRSPLFVSGAPSEEARQVRDGERRARVALVRVVGRRACR